MKLETPFRLVAAAGLTLIVWASGCHTRTPIGELPDAGEGNDGWLSEGAVAPGTGGVAGGQGGRTGAGGGSPATGGTAGTTVCQTHNNPMGAAGQPGDPCYPLTYPSSGFYGDNILADGCTTFTSSVNYDLAVTLPSTSATVQVTLTALSPTGAAGQAGFPGWGYAVDGDWRATAYDPQTQQQLFQTRPLSENETMIKFRGTGSARVEIYECDLTTPARSKTISWAPASP